VQPDNFSPEDLVELTPLDRTLGWFE
jgi:hypothetical protein